MERMHVETGSPGTTPTPRGVTQPRFPFAAIVGQDGLRTALLLVAIDPLIGGVLIEGPRGTAKSTSARALADLLPRGGFVDLPLGCSEEQLIGTLDLDAALGRGELRFRPGLLARADEGVLYVDEVNLLADGLVDLLLDVSASGINLIERDGISHAHPARFVLVGTMNPEEGELRPQLLDRFGLYVRLEDRIDVATRQAIVRGRLAFDADPAGFVAVYAEAQRGLAQAVVEARARLSSIPVTDALHERIAILCHDAEVEGVRADMALLRAARAHAALQRRTGVSEADLVAVADWVLAHRRRAGEGSGDGDEREQREVRSARTRREDAADPLSGRDDPQPMSTDSGPGHEGMVSGGADRRPGPALDQGRDATQPPTRPPSSATDPSAGASGNAPTGSGHGSAVAQDVTDDGGGEGTAEGGADGDAEGDDWGVLAPEPLLVRAVKPVRPLSPKKR